MKNHKHSAPREKWAKIMKDMNEQRKYAPSGSRDFKSTEIKFNTSNHVFDVKVSYDGIFAYTEQGEKFNLEPYINEDASNFRELINDLSVNLTENPGHDPLKLLERYEVFNHLLPDPDFSDDFMQELEKL